MGHGQADTDKASFLAVASTDPASFIAVLMLFCTAAIVVTIFIHSQVTGIQPQESWTEVSVGVALIATVFLAAIIYRARSINRLLSHNTRQTARVDRYLAVGIWVIVQLQYEWNGIQAERRIWLANSKRSRRLDRVSEVTLAMDPASSGRIVITDLFA
jgi:hypothetical protein